MNLLKAMDITGSLCPTHGKLTVQYTFENTAVTPCAPRFFFSLPEKAAICGLQLLTRDKTLLRARIQEIDGPCEEDCGYRLTEVESGLYCLFWEELLPGETCTLLVESILCLFPRENLCRFVFPLHHAIPCSVTLTLEGMTPQTYGDTFRFDPEKKTLSATAAEAKDFVLDCKITDEESCGLLQESFGNGLGFYRLYTQNRSLYQVAKKRRVTLFLDWNGLSSVRQINAVKELAFRVLSLLPADVSARIPALWQEDIPMTDDNRQEVFAKLQTLTDTDDMTSLGQADTDEDGFSILISGGFSHLPNEISNHKAIHLFTIGNHCQTPVSKVWKQLRLGEVFHFYPEDGLEDRTAAVLSFLLYHHQIIDLIPEGSNLHELFLSPETSFAGNGYLDVAVSYTGRPPKSFAVQKAGRILETVSLEKINAMPHFPEAARLYALGKIRHLTGLLGKVSPTSVRALKKQLAETQVKHQLLGSETRLALPFDFGNTIHLPVYCFDSLAGSKEDFSHRPTIFGESLRILSPSRQQFLFQFCQRILYGNIRQNGGIFSFDTLLPKEQAEETALAALALLDIPEASSVLEDALCYLESAPSGHWQLLLRALQDGKPVRNEILNAIPNPEELRNQLQSPIPCVKTAAMLLLRLQ